MAESKNASESDSPSTEELTDAIVDDDDSMKSIGIEISNVLSLDDNENKDKIVNDLLQNGRQSLIKYEEDVISKTYKEVMNDTDNKLMELLKMYFEKKWETQYGASNPWFISFLEQYKNGEDHDIYERVLIRTAEYGNKYMKDCPILSIVLQFLFESIDDECLMETKVFDDLWFIITNDGLKSITKYSDYIVKKIMDEQLKSESVLFQALQEYYREKVFSVLQENNIAKKGDLYELALVHVVEDGWLTDLKSLEDNMTPKSYKKSLEKLHSLHQKQKPAEKDNAKVAAAASTLDKSDETSGKQQDNFVWPTVTCDGCKMKPLLGKRYICKTCGNYDLCTQCQQKGHEHKLELLPQPIDDKTKSDCPEDSKSPFVARAGFTAAQNACQIEALKLHNTLRKRHGCPALVLDDDINRKAQAYADYLARSGRFQHSSDRNSLGENLYSAWSSAATENTGFGTKATQSWYDEIKDYNFNRQGFSMSTGHFTQVVWKSSEKLGMGVGFADGGRKVIVVAQYGPAGNMMGSFPQNVPPPR